MSAATAVVLVYSVKTVGRNWEWDNALSLAESAVPVNPSNAKVFATIANHYAQNVRVMHIIMDGWNDYVINLINLGEHNTLLWKSLAALIIIIIYNSSPPYIATCVHLQESRHLSPFT